MALFGESFDSLWKQVQAAEDKDLPQTELAVLEKIVQKAQKQRAYGQLMTAELKLSQVSADISPDSLAPAVARIKARAAEANDIPLRAVYDAVLGRIYSSNYEIRGTDDDPAAYYKRAMAHPKELAATKAGKYKPLIVMGADSEIYDNDLLSVIGMVADDYQTMHDWYDAAGNRRAACLTALELLRDECPNGKFKLEDSEYIARLDSLIDRYQDVAEVGEVVKERYRYMANFTDATAAQKMAYIEESLQRYGSWKGIGTLRNERIALTEGQFYANLPQRVVTTRQEQMLKLKNIRNLQSVTINIYRVDADGRLTLNPNSEKDYKKLQPMLHRLTDLTQTREYVGHQDYELFEDSLTLPSLPAGVYMIEALSSPKYGASRSILFVSDVRLLTEGLPNNDMRMVVVDATTGHPIAGAQLSLELYTYVKRDSSWVVRLVTDEHGECRYTIKDKQFVRSCFVYTDSDKSSPAIKGSFSQYRYNAGEDDDYYEVFTDRSIYRPGQTVHVAAIAYSVREGIKQQAIVNRPLTFTLHDANSKVVAEQRRVTDAFGTASVDFVLPKDALTGRFSIIVGDYYYSFRVEEYKRPSFEVSFDEVKQLYEPGDTVPVKGKALTYAGVPVQEGKVHYTVMRRRAWWWWRYSAYEETTTIIDGSTEKVLAEGDTMTGADGTFTIDTPMELPPSDHPIFVNIVVRADVTDVAGETHSSEIALSLGNRKTSFGCTLWDQVLIDSEPTYSFTYYNASGSPIDSVVNYRIDGGAWQTVRTNKDVALAKLPSGAHLLEAICGTDSLEYKFTVFSLDDQRPCKETDDWFYVSDYQFPNDGKPVTVQAGSSADDVYILYNVFSADRIIESGHVMKSNELINRKLTYREEYGDAALLTYAWVKNGRCYHHTVAIKRPLPDKELKLEWKTFRDKLTPGQQEQWTLTVKKNVAKPGEKEVWKPVSAQLMATLYDYSLDQLNGHRWGFSSRYGLGWASTDWRFTTWGGISLSVHQYIQREDISELEFSSFDDSLFPNMRRYSRRRLLGAGIGGMVLEEAPVMMMAKVNAYDEKSDLNRMTGIDDGNDDVKVIGSYETVDESLQGRIAGLDIISKPGDLGSGEPQVQLRENLQETAFFYPQLQADANGVVTMQFTLPESLTTWRFMGFAHTPDMQFGTLAAKAVAKKDVMVQPNMPRFVRQGDKATVSARLFNTSGHAISGQARMELLDPETEKLLATQTKPFSVEADATGSITFDIDTRQAPLAEASLLICRVSGFGEGFSDGEQHYLPILPNKERVTVSRPFTQNEPGTTQIDLTQLVPADATGGQLTIEYTNNPAWLVVQSLPSMSLPSEDNAISLAAAYYANSLGKFIVAQIPNAKQTFELWEQETGKESSLTSNLEKNQELKDILLNETPWVMEAAQETAQMHQLADFFSQNNLNQRTASALERLGKLQRADGSWSWWEGMSGSYWMTVEISEMLVRLNAMAGVQDNTRAMLDKAFGYMQREIAEEVKRLKEWEKEGHTVSFPNYKALQYLYICTLDGRKLSASAEKDNEYLVKLLRKDIKQQDLYDKAVTAIILEKYDRKTCLEYVQSLKEYTVYNEEKGRYYDTHRAGYSWFDYRIPTQVAAIEAIGRLTPDDKLTIQQMQRWLLQEKRTTSWDTPINSVNAIYAFLTGNKQAFAPQEKTRLAIDGTLLELPKATAGLGYVKTRVEARDKKTFTAEKTSEGVSWGAVYAQFMQHTGNIADSGSGMTVKREVMKVDQQRQLHPIDGPLQVGDMVRVVITIDAERDYDFIQVLDRRAACMEPVRQLSGYHNGAYCAPKDNATNYYYDQLPKGRQVITNDYYIDRAGTYETGTCTVECAYAPEYRAKTKSQTVVVEN